MNFLFWVFLFFIIFLIIQEDAFANESFQLSDITSKAISATEYNALYDLYQATNGKYWNWYNTTPPSYPWNFDVYDLNAPCSDDWQGLKCSCIPSSCVISEINLPRHDLHGSLPGSLGNLSSLSLLFLDENRINGPIPEMFHNLTKLEIFSVSKNRITGSIPKTIGMATMMTQLTLSLNMLNGTIPESLYQLKNLTILLLQFNFFHGTLSPALGNLTNLQHFKLEHNHFHGRIPKAIGELKSLNTCVLSVNDFTGPLPEDIYNLLQIRIFDVSENHFTGTISPAVGNWSHLNTFFSYHNQFFGSLPVTLFNPVMPMRSIDFEGNLLSGPIPPEMGGWSYTLQTIFLSTNSFTGTIPNNLSHLYVLYSSQFDDNFFHGNVQHIYEDVPNMFYLAWSSNMFTGLLPNSTKWYNITYYIMGGNYFTGPIPVFPLALSRTLYYLDLSYSYLTGSIPRIFNNQESIDNSSIIVSNTTNNYILSYVNLTNNLLTGSLNNTFGNVPSIVSLILGNNFFTQSIPPAFGHIRSLFYLFLNNNDLTGSIPAALKRLKNLKVLFLQENHLTGTIPSLLNWNSLEDADVSNNQLSGTLPLFLARNPSLATFAASSNCFSGSIPITTCNITSLEVLSLNGLSTASSCRRPLFPGSSILTAFSLRITFQGGIPDCLFTLPNLQILHVSGNGFGGTLPDIKISDALVDLTVSHNVLTGTIPVNYQTKYWRNFDVSYNRLTGVLSSDYYNFNDSSSSSIALDVNRLSGRIPSALIDTAHINIVEGNMFSCNYDRSDLPKHDVKSNDYACGSDVVNIAVYTWIALIAIIVGLIVAFLKLFSKSSRFTYICSCCSGLCLTFQRLTQFISKVLIWRKTFVEFCLNIEIQAEESRRQLLENENNSSISSLHLLSALRSTTGNDEQFQRNPFQSAHDAAFQNLSKSLKIPELDNQDSKRYRKRKSKTISVEYSRIYKLSVFFQRLRFLFMCLIILLSLLIMPSYGITSFFYHEFDFSYAWTVSALLKTGKNAGIILEILFFFLICSLIYLFYLIIDPSRKKKTHTNNNTTFSSGNPSKANNSSIVRLRSFFGRTFSLYNSHIIDPEEDDDDDNDIQDDGLVNGNIRQTNERETDFDLNHLGNRINSLFMTTPIDYLRESIFHQETSYISFFTLVIVGFINCILMIAADVLYVWVILNYDTTIILLAEFFLAIFKILLNNSLLWLAIPYVYDFLLNFSCKKILQKKKKKKSSINHNTDNDNNVEEDDDDAENEIQLYHYSLRDLSFISFTILLNNIIFPAIAILVISPDCFFNAFFSAQQVTSSYDYTICFRYSVFNPKECFDYVTNTVVSTYTPPFTYSYQCSSLIVINYAAVFIIMYTFEGIIQPLFKLFLKFIYDLYFREEYINTFPKSRAISLDIPNEKQNNNHDEEGQQQQQFQKNPLNSAINPPVNINLLTSKFPSKQNLEHSIRSVHGDTIISIERTGLRVIWKSNQPISWFLRIFFSFLPNNLTMLIQEPPREIQESLLLFDKNRIIVRLTAYLVVFMSFGVLFPPLACIAGLTACSLTYYEEMVIGRYIYESGGLQNNNNENDNQSSQQQQLKETTPTNTPRSSRLLHHFSWYRRQLDNNCSGITNALKYSLWTLVPLCGLLFSYIIFDTFGDDVGWESAFIPTFLMLFIPSVFLYVYSRQSKKSKSQQPSSSSSSSSASSQTTNTNNTTTTRTRFGNLVSSFSSFVSRMMRKRPENTNANQSHLKTSNSTTNNTNNHSNSNSNSNSKTNNPMDIPDDDDSSFHDSDIKMSIFSSSQFSHSSSLSSARGSQGFPRPISLIREKGATGIKEPSP